MHRLVQHPTRPSWGVRGSVCARTRAFRAFPLSFKARAKPSLSSPASCRSLPPPTLLHEPSLKHGIDRKRPWASVFIAKSLCLRVEHVAQTNWPVQGRRRICRHGFALSPSALAIAPRFSPPRWSRMRLRHRLGRVKESANCRTPVQRGHSQLARLGPRRPPSHPCCSRAGQRAPPLALA